MTVQVRPEEHLSCPRCGMAIKSSNTACVYSWTLWSWLLHEKTSIFVVQTYVRANSNICLSIWTLGHKTWYCHFIADSMQVDVELQDVAESSEAESVFRGSMQSSLARSLYRMEPGMMSDGNGQPCQRCVMVSKVISKFNKEKAMLRYYLKEGLCLQRQQGQLKTHALRVRTWQWPCCWMLLLLEAVNWFGLWNVVPMHACCCLFLASRFFGLLHFWWILAPCIL